MLETGTQRAADDARPPEGRRERIRRETFHELKQAALAEVREQGAVGLSLRAVARRMGMSPAGLYRYVTSREDLLTMLIADGYHDLGAHIEVAVGLPVDTTWTPDRPVPRPPVVAATSADVADRTRAASFAYRHWAITHPNEFGLLFGDPIQGYEAPVGGPTVEAMRRVGRALGAPLVEARAAGRLRVHPVIDPLLVAGLAPMIEEVGEDDPALALTLLCSWSRLHGQVILEVFGHFNWLFPEAEDPMFAASVEAHLADLGLIDPAHETVT